MKPWLIETAGKLGGYQAARLVTRRQPKILMYHRFSESASPGAVSKHGFERELCIIKRWFQPMTLTRLAHIVGQGGKPPKNAVVITVDDGYRDFYEIAYPLLRHYDVPATFFVTTGFINRDLWLWPDQVSWLLERKEESLKACEIAGTVFDMDQPSGKVWQRLIDHFLSVSNGERLIGLSQLQNVCAQQLPGKPPKKFEGSTWKQLEEMQAQGIEIGGHTYSHPSLGRMSELEVDQELDLTSELLKNNLGDRPRTFCYPNGSPLDYSNRVKQQVKAAGYIAAVTAFHDCYNLDIEFAWRRFATSGSKYQFYKSLYGVAQLGNKLRGTIRADY